MPDVMTDFVTDEDKGKILVPLGDAFLVKRCVSLYNYHVFYNQSLNNTCYNLPPVQLQDGSIKFLEITSRRITTTAHKIDCRDRPNEIFLQDEEGQFWSHDKNGTLTKISLTTKRFHHGKLKLPKLASFQEKLLHRSNIMPHRTHLLHLVAMQQDNLQELTDLRDTGGGSVIEGITHGITKVITSLTGSGLQLVKGVAAGMTTVVNETSGVVAGAIHGFGQILSFTNGVSGFILYIIDFLIIAYLAAMRIWDRRINNRLRDAQRERDQQIIRITRNQPQEGDIHTVPPLRAQ